MISSINLAAMQNSLHVEFINSILTMIGNYGGSATLGLSETTIKAFTETAEKEQDHVNRPKRSAYTTRLAELDTLRDGLLGNILSRLGYAWTSSDATVQAAMEDIRMLILECYPLSIKNEAAQRKTSHINGLVLDLDKLDEGVLKKLGVDELAKDLKTANGSFEQAYLARNLEFNARGTGVMVAVRAECDSLFRRVCVEAEYVAHRTDGELAAIEDSAAREKATAQRTLMRNFVEELNRHIAYYKAYYLRKGASAGTEDAYPDADDVYPDGDGAHPDAPGDGTEADADGDDPAPDAPGHGGPTDVTEVLSLPAPAASAPCVEVEPSAGC